MPPCRHSRDDGGGQHLLDVPSRGHPLTLVDTGPANDRALSPLERSLREHGVPTSRPTYACTRRSNSGRWPDLRVVQRPGHSATEALFVDDEDRIGILGRSPAWPRSPPAPTSPRRQRPTACGRAPVSYLERLWRTAPMPLRRLLTSHRSDSRPTPASCSGAALTTPALRADDRCVRGRAHHSVRTRGQLWTQRTVTRQALLICGRDRPPRPARGQPAP